MKQTTAAVIMLTICAAITAFTMIDNEETVVYF